MESNGCRIKKIDGSTGIINTIAGIGISAYSGDGGPATDAALRVPQGITGDAAGNLYITEYGSSTIRKIDATTGIITTIAGAGVGGDGGPATDALLHSPDGLYIDNGNNIFFADRENHRIRKINGNTGIISTIVGTFTYGYSGDGGPATDAELLIPIDVLFDDLGNMYIASNAVIRRVTPAGIISTFVGTNVSGYSGDGGPALDAQLGQGWGLAMDAAGALYISDAPNDVIRKVTRDFTAVDNTENNTTGITVYPNPSKSVIIVAGIKEATNYKLLNIAGANVLNGSFKTGSNKLDIRNLAAGTYLLKTESSNSSAAFTIIKQ